MLFGFSAAHIRTLMRSNRFSTHRSSASYSRCSWRPTTTRRCHVWPTCSRRPLWCVVAWFGQGIIHRHAFQQFYVSFRPIHWHREHIWSHPPWCHDSVLQRHSGVLHFHKWANTTSGQGKAYSQQNNVGTFSSPSSLLMSCQCAWPWDGLIWSLGKIHVPVRPSYLVFSSTTLSGTILLLSSGPKLHLYLQCIRKK